MKKIASSKQIGKAVWGLAMAISSVSVSQCANAAPTGTQGASTVLVGGEMPLTRKITDGSLDFLYFKISEVLGRPVVASSEDKDLFAQEMAVRYAALSTSQQKAFRAEVKQERMILIVYAMLKEEDKAQYRAQWAQELRPLLGSAVAPQQQSNPRQQRIGGSQSPQTALDRTGATRRPGDYYYAPRDGSESTDDMIRRHQAEREQEQRANKPVSASAQAERDAANAYVRNYGQPWVHANNMARTGGWSRKP